ncbi:MAG: NADH-quinone oxidoreductase subunit C [Rubrivivax sp.]
MTQSIDTLQSALTSVLGGRVKALGRDRGELTVTVSAADYADAATTLRDHADLRFEQMMDLCGLDYSEYRNEPRDGPRYCVALHLLSLTHNWRVRLKVWAPDDDLPAVASVNGIWSAANWFEREAFDLYGIVFEGHDDLRRILTDYGFIGHPMRKDFPTTGNVEMRYDAEQRRVIYQPVSIEPREIVPRVVREDAYGHLPAETRVVGTV